MFKYMKYEIKGSYKYILGILALVLILITGLYAYVGDLNGDSMGGNLFVGLSVLILFGTVLSTFFFIVGSFRKELFEDRGYLTFTLPLTGNQIVGSKLIVALLWFFILGTVIGLYNLIMAVSFTPVDLKISELVSIITQAISFKAIIFVTVATVFTGVNMLIIIYFSMALSRVTFRNKRIGSLWFVIFLIVSGLLAYGQIEFEKLFPYILDLETFKVGTKEMLNAKINIGLNNGVMHSTMDGVLQVNIATSIYSIVTTVALFLGTGYLIEKKIDL